MTETHNIKPSFGSSIATGTLRDLPMSHAFRYAVDLDSKIIPEAFGYNTGAELLKACAEPINNQIHK